MSAAAERVLVLCTDRGIPIHGPSGASAHLRGVARALARRGLDVRVATPLDHDHRGRWDAPLGPPAVHAPDPDALIARATDAWSPDLLWERHTLHPEAGIALAERFHIPRVVELNAPLVLERDRFDPIPPRRHARAVEAERRSLQRADRVLAVSQWLAGWAVDEAGVAPDRVHHVPNGVRPAPPGDRTRVRRDLGVGDRLLVGFVGTFKPWHGVDRLPALLDALGPEAMGLAVGSGPISAPVHSRLRLVPTVQPAALPHLISAMDVGLAPYRTEAPPWFCPLKILDYRAQGVPVVAADVGDSALLVGDGGRVVRTDASDAWVEAIRAAAGLPRTPWSRTWDDVVAEGLSAARR